MYGSFSNFNTLIQQSQFEDQRYFDSINNKSVYYAKIIFDNNTIDYAWEIDSIRDISGIVNIETNQLAVYPNPVKDEVTVDLTLIAGSKADIEIYNLSGQLVFRENHAAAQSTHRINTAALPAGIYTLSALADGKIYRSRIVKIE
jgi:hypothetical protein